MNPKTLLPVLISAGLGATSIQAQVTLTFDTDLEGFVAQGDVTSAEWSSFGGGTMRMEDAGAWGGNGAQLGLGSNAEMWAELQLAVINGGTISYDFTVVDADQEYTAAPSWFQTVIIGNSGGTGGWDQTVINSGIGGGDWPVDDTFSVSVPIQPTAGGAVDGGDGQWFVDLADGWANIHLGMNSDNSGTLTKSVVYFDNITIDANEVAAPPPALDIMKATKGLNLISANGGIYDRRMVRTTEAANSWIGVATSENPVTYSITVKESDHQGYVNFIYLVPSVDGAEIPDYTDPDYNAPHCLRVEFQRDNAGEPGASGSVAYKVDSPGSNGPDDHQYWVNDSEGESTGLGGTLAYVGSANITGTWSLTFTSDTEFTITSPDGTESSGAMLPATAALFDADVHVYFGSRPIREENLGLGTVYSNITISGIDFFIDDNFTDFIDEDGFLMPDSFLQIAPEGRTGVVVANHETDFWLQWSLPAPGYLLEQSLDLGEPGPWETMLMDNAFNVQGEFGLLLLDSLEALDTEVNYFRMAKPDPGE